LSHSSIFWRTVQSKLRWPAETLLGRALERRWRTWCFAGLAAPRAVRRPPRRLGVYAGPFPTASSHEPLVPSRARLLGRRVICAAPYSSALRCPTVHRQSRAHASQDGRRTVALKPTSRRCALPLNVAHRPAPRRPQHTLVALPVRPTEVPLLRPVRRRPAPLAAPLDPTTYRCRLCSFPNREAAGTGPAAAVFPGRRRPAKYRRPSADPRPQIGCG
jgi:hypothetical protein